MLRRLPSFLAGSRDPTSHPDDLDAASPPPYTAASTSPFLFTETRTTRTQVITTTTETTTHVLPIDEYSGTSLKHSAGDVKPNAERGAGSSHLLSLDKDLPPIPHPTSVSFDCPRPSVASSSSFRSTSKSPSASHVQHPRPEALLPPSPSDFLHQPTLSAATPVFFPHLSASVENSLRPPLRKAKSSQKLSSSASPSSVEDALSPRSRGVSFGALSWLSLGSADTKGKGKQKAKDQDADTQTHHDPSVAPKSLTRKSSFWSKKRNVSQTHRNSVVEDSDFVSPTLASAPALPPLDLASKFDLGQSILSSSPPQRWRPTSLMRRHSENFTVTPTKSEFFSSSVAPAWDTEIDLVEEPPSQSKPQPSPPKHSLSLPPDQAGHNAAETPELSPSPRPRAQTNPPLLHRLSTALFSSFSDTLTTPASPRPSFSLTPSPSLSTHDIPKPLDANESPAEYVSRLRKVVSKSETVSVLASSSDPFYVEALQCFLQQFDFNGQPLDIALRKLLMEVGLPRETQQIDRVIEAFSSRYSECNQNLFGSKDHGYVLAFSLIMLHTDAFNSANKNKMTKPDYIKNTSFASLPSEVLGCYYDNIVFAPFIFIEDPLDSDKQVTLTPDGTSRTPRTPSTPSNNSNSLLGKNKIDPYYLILNDLLDSMRDEVEKIVPLDEPFSYSGIGGRVWSDEELQRAFMQSPVVPVDLPHPRSSVTLHHSGSPADPEFNAARSPEHAAAARPLAIRITNIGVLNRKDDIGVRGKRNTFRKWRYWTVLLTGSKLLFFRDLSLAGRVLRRVNLAEDALQDFSLGGALLKPDEVISVKDAIAVHDSTYKKHDHAFRLVLSDGRQTLLQASNVDDMDEWLMKINYASAFKSAGVQIRPLGMTTHEVEMTGVAAATSFLHDVQYSNASPSTPIRPWDSSISHDLMGMLSADSFVYPTGSPQGLVTNPYHDPDLDSPSIVEKAAAAQFESTFQKVKEDLVQDGFCSMENESERPALEFTAPSPLEGTSPTRPPTRSSIIRREIDVLQSELVAVQAELDSDLRVVRNIAILKPFQKAMRARLLNPVQAIAGKVASLRLKIALLECHLLVLQRDLELEMRSLGQIQSAALAAAKKSLERGSEPLPGATTSLHSPEDELEMPLGRTISRRSSATSAAESFRSALDWAPEEMEATPLSLAPSQLFESPQTPDRGPNESSSSLLQRSSSYAGSVGESHKDLAGHSGDDLVEEAEVWNRTRAAQRVSLIHVPSTISFSRSLRQDGRN